MSFTQLGADFWFWPVTISACFYRFSDDERLELLTQKKQAQFPGCGGCNYWLFPVITALAWPETRCGKLLAVLSWPERERIQTLLPCKENSDLFGEVLAYSADTNHPRDCRQGEKALIIRTTRCRRLQLLCTQSQRSVARCWSKKTVVVLGFLSLALTEVNDKIKKKIVEFGHCFRKFCIMKSFQLTDIVNINEILSYKSIKKKPLSGFALLMAIWHFFDLSNLLQLLRA